MIVYGRNPVREALRGRRAVHAVWATARAARPSDVDRRVMLVGPGLGSGGAEVPAVAGQDPGVEVLDGADATVAAALTALDGAALAHVAAHGHFREDSPLFSSLTLADGPLLVHDLQRLQRPPHRVVLSACETGLGTEVDGQGVMGLRAAFTTAGARSVLMSLWPVPDEGTAMLMRAFYRGLWGKGIPVAEALRDAQAEVRADPRYASPLHWAGWMVVGRGW